MLQERFELRTRTSNDFSRLCSRWQLAEGTDALLAPSDQRRARHPIHDLAAIRTSRLKSADTRALAALPIGRSVPAAKQ